MRVIRCLLAEPRMSDLQSVIQNVSRLAALQRLGVLDTAPEQGFDRLSKIACRMLRAPISLISLVDRDRQFFKSCVGLPEPFASRQQTPLSHSFCQHVVGSGRPLIIEDARSNPLVRANPAVEEMGIAAYAGIPLITSAGQIVGSFCVIDHRPRAWTFDDIEALQEIAACVMQEMESRVLLRETEARCRQLEARLRERDAGAADRRS